jgi:hypothetical protein
LTQECASAEIGRSRQDTSCCQGSLSRDNVCDAARTQPSANFRQASTRSSEARRVFPATTSHGQAINPSSSNNCEKQPALTMADSKENIDGLFAPSVPNGLALDVMGELESIMRLHSISPQELFYKWESYSMKMGAEDTKLDLDTVRMFKKDVQNSVERSHPSKHTGRGSERKSAVASTPRAPTANGDVFGMCVVEILYRLSYLRC